MTSSASWSPIAETSSAFADLSLSPVSADYPVANLTGLLEGIGAHPFACGGYSEVYKFRSRKELSLDGPSTRRTVFAVKTANASLRIGNSTKGLRKMRREIGVWASLEHRNILKLHGILYMGTNSIPSLVSDYMENGTAMQYLLEHPTSNFIQMVCDIAKGLTYLHSLGFAHGDIKADNIFVDHDGCGRIGDFGLSRMLGHDGLALELSNTDGNRSNRWMAIEYLQFRSEVEPPEGPTKPGDVWSFGCTVLQLFSGQPPFHDAKDPEVVLRLSNRELPKFPPNLLRPDFEKYRAGISAFCRLCWVKTPIDRPEMSVLESVICSYCHESTCNDLSELNGTTQCSSSPQERLQDSSEINGSDVTSSDGTRTRTSSQSTITASFSLNEQLQIPFLSEPQYEPDPDPDALFGPKPQGQPEPSPLSVPEPQEEQHRMLSPTVPPTAQLPVTPPLAPPSVESMLRRNNLSARSILDELVRFINGFSIRYVDRDSTGPSHYPTHVVACYVNNEQYGVGEVVGTKKTAKERAAVAAVERLYLEDPTLPLSLCYLPLLTDHLNKNNLNARATWTSQYGTRSCDPEIWEYQVTFTFDGITVANGLGRTFSIAEEDAARKVGLVWNQTIANGA